MDRLGPNVRECPSIYLEERKITTKIPCQDSPNSENEYCDFRYGMSSQSVLGLIKHAHSSVACGSEDRHDKLPTHLRTRVNV
jgi:hypothetical protein